MQGEKWDVSWVNHLTGKHKAVFDVPEVDSGFGVWRATIWAKQYQDVLGYAPKDMSPVLVLRHNGIVLAMQQPFWDDQHRQGEERNASDHQPADGSQPGAARVVAEQSAENFDPMALDKYIARGGIAPRCNLAFGDCVELVKSKENVSDAEARKQAMSFLVPGVILQPSVFRGDSGAGGRRHVSPRQLAPVDMRALLLGFSLLFVTQAKWKEIGKTMVGNPVFLDPKSVKKGADGIITATLRVPFVKPVATPKGPITSSVRSRCSIARRGSSR